MRLIDADTLKARAIRCSTLRLGSTPTYFKAVGTKEIDKAPTIDAEPVRHGHWVATSDPKENVFGAVRYLCSVCDDVVYFNPLKIDLEKYCRCCGAKNDEVSE